MPLLGDFDTLGIGSSYKPPALLAAPKPKKKKKKKYSKPKLIPEISSLLARKQADLDREELRQIQRMKAESVREAVRLRMKGQKVATALSEAQLGKSLSGLKRLPTSGTVRAEILERGEQLRAAQAPRKFKEAQARQSKAFVAELQRIAQARAGDVASAGPKRIEQDLEKVFLSLTSQQKADLIRRFPAAFPEATRELGRATREAERASEPGGPGLGGRVLDAVGSVFGLLDSPREAGAREEAAKRFSQKLTFEQLWTNLTSTEQGRFIREQAKLAAYRRGGKDEPVPTFATLSELANYVQQNKSNNWLKYLREDLAYEVARDPTRRKRVATEFDILRRFDTGITQFLLDPTIYLPGLGQLRAVNSASKAQTFLRLGGKEFIDRAAITLAREGDNIAAIARRLKLPAEVAERIAREAAGNADDIARILTESLGKEWAPNITRRSVARGRLALQRQGATRRGLERLAGRESTEFVKVQTTKALAARTVTALRKRQATVRERIAKLADRQTAQEAQLARLTPARAERATNVRQNIAGLRLQRQALTRLERSMEQRIAAGKVVERQVLKKTLNRGLKAQGAAAAAKAARGVLSLVDSAAPNRVIFELKNHAHKAMSRYTKGLRLGTKVQDDLTNKLLKARTLEEAQKAVSEAVQHYAVRQGLSAEQAAKLLAFYRTNLDEFDKSFTKSLYGPSGQRSAVVHTQLRNEIFLPDVHDLDRAIRQIKAGRKVTGKSGLALRGLKGGHRLWKFATVTGPSGLFGLAGAGVGATTAIVATPARLVTSLVRKGAKRDLDAVLFRPIKKAAAAGAHVGAGIGGLQYTLRVAVIEEMLGRSFATHGVFRSIAARLPTGVRERILLRGLSPEQKALFLNELRMNRHLVWANPENDWAGHAFLTRPGEAVLLSPTDPRFIDQWWHAVNYQLHHNDPVIRELMEGAANRSVAQAKAVRWMESSEDGKAYLKEMVRTRKFKDAKGVVAKAQEFIDEIATHPDLVRAWQAGPVDKSLLKDLLRQGAAPKAIHALDQRLINPLRIDDLRSVVSKAVLTGPTNALNRFPYLAAEMADQYKRLLADGVPTAQAAKIAAQRGVEKTNAIMFSLDGMTRFAKRADYVAPFQQVREELLRVYGKVAIENPVRVLRMYKAGKTLFNIGIEEGWVYKDQYGNWVVKIPGSALLTRLLTGHAIAKTLPLQRLWFLGQGTPGLNVLPTPGGPYLGTLTSGLFRAYPNLFPNGLLKEWLVPFGSTGHIHRENLRQILVGIMPGFGNAWWDAMGKDAQQESLNALAQQVYAAMYVDWKEGHGPEPTAEMVKNMTKELTLASGILGALLPGGGNFVIPQREVFDKEIAPLFKLPNGSLDISALLERFPQYQPFLTKTGKWVGPDDYWQQPGLAREALSEAEKFRQQLYTEKFTPEEFIAEVKNAERISLAFKRLAQIVADPTDPALYFARQEQVLREFPELKKMFEESDQRDTDYVRIRSVTDLALRDKLLKEWRFKYKVSKSAEEKLSFRYARGVLGNKTVWDLARDIDQVLAGWQKAKSSGRSLKQYMATLNAAESVKLITNLQRGASLAEYRRLQDLKGELYGTHSELLQPRPIDPLMDTHYKRLERELSKRTSEFYEDQTKLYDRVGQLSKAMDAAADAKQWALFYSLKDQRTKVYDQIRLLKNSVYRKFPDFQLIANTLKDGWFELEDDPSVIKELNRQGLGFLALAPEERLWRNLDDAQREEYLNELLGRLDQPGKTQGKLYWEWLTDFQRDLLQGYFGYDKAKQWSLKTYGGDQGGGGGFSVSEGEIAFALAMFKQYSKRAQGAKPPAAYAQYLALPNNRALRIAFLNEHPEVREWLALGPMANMPPMIRNLVAHIMIKHGRWEGDARTIDELTEISFAQQQLEKWTRRKPGERAPATFDKWLNMPTGVGKAAYLKAHPEIQDWLSRGPMSNMPDSVKEVVREIMLGYGLWGEREDPLSKLISEYMQLPSSAKGPFLEKHPELVEYWRALRPPEERPLFDLANRYFALPDAQSKRFFLESHPELKDYFVRERERRYERFLNRVSFYLGTNPELVTSYLDQQTRILSSLLARFGESPLLPERTTTRTNRNRRAA